MGIAELQAKATKAAQSQQEVAPQWLLEANVDKKRNQIPCDIPDIAPPAYKEATEGPLDIKPTGNEDYDELVQECRAVIVNVIQYNEWQTSYTEAQINGKALKGPAIVRKIMQLQEGFPRKYAIYIAATCLCDWVFLIDDSGSMNDDRFSYVEWIGCFLGEIAGLADEDGFQVRAMNTELSKLKNAAGEELQDHCKSADDFKTILKYIKEQMKIQREKWGTGQLGTPEGTTYLKKIFEPMIKARIKRNEFRAPTRLFVLGDGRPTNEDTSLITKYKQTEKHVPGNPESEAEVVMKGALADTFNFLEQTAGHSKRSMSIMGRRSTNPWGKNGLTIMFGVVGRVNSAGKFRMSMDDDKRWDKQCDWLLSADAWIQLMDKRFPEVAMELGSGFTLFDWVLKLIASGLVDGLDGQDPTKEDVDELMTEQF
nr:hypothetical protein LTR18_011063 [Exophiala xenobiotica]